MSDLIQRKRHTIEKHENKYNFFDLTEEGFKALKKAYRTQQSMWDGVTEESFDKSYI